MATLAQTLSKTITDQLLGKLPAALATEYGLEADAASTFLSTFLAAQLPAAGKAKKERSPSPKGTNGKGRTNAFMLFSQEERQKVIEEERAAGKQFYKQKKSGKQQDASGKAKVVWVDALDAAGQRIPSEAMPQHLVATRIGERWQALSAEAKAEWAAKAVAINTANGLPPAEKSPKPKAAVAVAKTAAPKPTTVAPATAKAPAAPCPSTLTRGPRKDQPCGAKVKAGETHCSKHNAAE